MSSFSNITMKSASRLVLLALAFAATRATAQQPTSARAGATVTLSLDDALKLVQTASQTIEVARAGVVRATGGKLQARSQYLPQLNATAGYTKTLKSQFSGFSAGSSGAATDTTGGSASDTTGSGGAAGGFEHGGVGGIAGDGADVEAVLKVAQHLFIGVDHRDLIGFLAGQVVSRRPPYLPGAKDHDLHGGGIVVEPTDASLGRKL